MHTALIVHLSKTGRIHLLKCFLTGFTLLLITGISNAQTITLLSPTGDGGFETGTTFAANGWTEVQAAGDARKWQVGTAAGVQAGSRAAYVGSATANNGIASAKVDHFYRDLVLPAAATNVQLSFYIKQATIDNGWDYFYVFTTTTANTPVTGTIPSTGYTQRFVNTATAYPSYTAIPSIDLSALAGTTVRLVFTFKSDGIISHANPAVDNISLTYVAPSICTGTPAPGNTLSSVANPVCAGTSVTLSLQNTLTASGITFQWQSSPDGVSWSSIAGAQSPTCIVSPSVSTYYHCLVTCTNSGQSATSGNLRLQTTNCVNMQNGSLTTCSARFYDSGGAAGSYLNSESYTYTVYPDAGNRLQVVFNSFNTESNYDFLTIYNGNTTAAPQLFRGSGTTSPGTIASTAADGSLTFQFTSDGSVTYAGWDATISCIVIPVCNGIPAAGIITGPSSVCSGTSTTLTANGASNGETGLFYEWEESDDNGVLDPWTSASGGSGVNTLSFTTPALTAAIYYRLMVFCTNSSQSAITTPVFIQVNQVPSVTISASSTTICGTGQVSLTAAGADAYSWSPGTGLNATTGTQVTASPASTTTYTVTGTSGACSASSSLAITVSPGVGSVLATADTTEGCAAFSTRLHVSACLNTTPTFTVDSSSINYSPSGSTGFLTMSSADDGFASVNLPFSFNYFGTSYTSAFVSTNGYLTFGSGSTTLTAQQLPNTTTPNNVIALCWNDLLHSGTATGVDTFTLGSPGHRKFVIRFNAGAVAFYNIGSQSGTFGGKIILHEGSNVVELRIDAMNMGTVTGRLKTLGVENSTGTIGIAAPGKNYSDWLVSTPVTYRFSPGYNCSGAGTFTYSWNPSAGLDAVTSSNPQLSDLMTSSIYTVTATAPSGCTATASIGLIVHPKPSAPVISASGPLSFCPGGSVVLTSSAPSGNSWSTGETTQSITVQSSSTVTLMETTGLCSSSTASANIVRFDTLQPLITIFGGGLTLCGGSRDLLCDGSPQYLSWNWSTGETSALITVSNPGTYSVVASDLNGCQTHNAITISSGSSPLAPFISASSPLTICNNEQVTFTSNLSDNILWFPTYDNTASITYNMSPPGVYDFYVSRDSLGCMSESNHLLITVNPVPEVLSMTPDNACPGTTITLGGFGFTNVTSIAFNGTPATAFHVTDDYTITVLIPPGATSGGISLSDGLTGCSGISTVFTVNPGTSTTTTISSCDSYTWPVTGQSYSTGGVYTFVSGCHTEILDLTILSCNVTLNLTMFLQGYYDPVTGLMNPVWSNQLRTDLGNNNPGVPTGNECDLVRVELYDASNTLAYADSMMLNTNGTGSLSLPPSAKGNSYYILIRHRSHLLTRSAGLVAMTTQTDYDFSTDAGQADQLNMVQEINGVWAFYSGDVNQDGFIGGDDVGMIDNDNLAGMFFEYLGSDLNGDGFVGGDDVGIADNNNLAGVYYIYP